MNQISIYQHPFVDVFKLTKISDWITCQKEGDVQDNVWDQALAKNYFRIQGTSSSSNYIQIPATKFLPKKALGLTGKYVYLIINVPEGKNCVMHLDYMVNDTRLSKISLSNIYKDFKNVNGSSLQIPLTVQNDRWTVVVVGVEDILRSHKLITDNSQDKFSLRSLQLCSSMNVRGVFTSDIQYQVSTLPKEMALKVPKDSDWFSHYSWFQYPSADQEGAPEPESAPAKKENQSIKANLAPKKTTKKSTKFQKQSDTSSMEPATEATSAEKQPKKGLKKPTNFKLGKGDFNNWNEVKDTKKEAFGITYEDNIKEEDFNGQIENTMKEIETLKEDYQYNLTAKNIDQTAEIKLYQEEGLYDPKVDPRNKGKDKFILKPNPIMRLDRVIGWHPHNTCGQIFFNRDPKLSQEILFTQANLLLGYYPPLQKQRLFYERHTNNIDQQFALNCSTSGKTYSVTICKSLEAKSKDNEVTIWSLDGSDNNNADSQSLMTFKPPFKSIHSISLSSDDEQICIAGKDHQIRDVIIVYKFVELIKYKKVEIVARQLADFETCSVKFNNMTPNSIIAIGKESIKFYKIKSGHLPGQAVLLNNTARGKVFNHAIVQHSENAKTVYITTTDGLLYYINYNTRQVEKIIQIHEGGIAGLLVSPNSQFYVTASQQGVLRIWSTDFETLKSEVNTSTQIECFDISSDSNQICVLSSTNGTISVLDLDNSSYNVVMRSHLDNVTDIAYNTMTNKLISVSEDFSVKVWHAETMEQVNEFISENDKPIRVVSQNQGCLGEGIKSQDSDCLVAIGFKSGFLRILDLSEMKIIFETLLFQSPVVDIAFSGDNKFMAIYYKIGKIVIINKERPGEFLPIKNIDWELPNTNYHSLTFSPDSGLLANISSNANTITVWETQNFSLRYHLDLTGDIISKIEFSPNNRDIVCLTTSSKLLFYRLGNNAHDTELKHIKDQYGITDMECKDFTISSNNKYIICTGKEGTIKVFDYFMRGDIVPSSQAFMGHYTFSNRCIISKDMRFVFSVGELNGIYKWSFYGDTTVPEDLSQHCEEIQEDIDAKQRESEQELENKRAHEGMFEQEDLQTYTQQQIEKFTNSNQNQNQNLNNQKMAQPEQIQKQENGFTHPNPFQHTIDLNKGGYVYELFELKLSKLLACSNGEQVKNNLVWNEKQRYMCYSVHNILVIEYMDQEKTQKLIKEGNDPIFNIKLSESKQYLLAYSKTGPIDGFPCIYIFDAVKFTKLNQIAISDAQIDSVEFSCLSNMLLVVSSTQQDSDSKVSTLTVWDFMDGHKDIFCKSMIPVGVTESAWNPFTQKRSDEFITISDRSYHYWRISEKLSLEYQEGELPSKANESFKDKSDKFTTLCFVRPDQLHHSVYCMLGLKSGYVWVVDSNVNQFLFNVKVLAEDAGGVNRIFSSHVRIIVESENDCILRCWDQSGKNGDREYSAYNPFNFFMGTESKLQLDGTVKSSTYNETGNEQLVLSTSGSIWYLSWIENCTLRLKYCHSPSQIIGSADFKYVSPSEFNIDEEKDQLYTFDQNYQITTSSSDGQIKLWNMHDIEYCQQFIVPKEECIYIAMHQFKPYMVTSFTDGYLRFFDINASKLLGRCKIYNGIEDKDPNTDQLSVIDYVISIKILPSGNHILAATKNGSVVLIFVQNWDPLAIKIESLVSIQTSIHTFEFSHLEPYNKWLVGTNNGKVIVYNRKDFNSLNQEIFDELNPPVFNYMDSFNILEYASNAFSQTRRCNTLDHYYNMSKRNLVYNEVDPEHACCGVFANNDLTLSLTFIKSCNMLFIRNFELHQVVKRIEMSASSLPKQMQLLPGSSPFVCCAMQDNSIKLIDFMNEENQASIQTLHDELTTMKICPNGRYVLSAGNRGDVCLWSINKKILQPEMINDAVKTDAA